MKNILILDVFIIFERQTKRTKFKTKSIYYRLDNRKTTIKLEDVPLTTEIREEALNKFISTLSVKTWDEYKSK